MKKPVLLDPSLPAADLAEGPYWDAGNEILYWVDITGKTIHRYHLSSGRHETCPTPSMAGFAVLDNKGRIIAGLQDGLYRVDDFENLNFTLLAALNPSQPQNRFNDAKCDPRGRLWAGTMNLQPDKNLPSGSLYRYEGSGLEEFENKIYISNGLGWSPDQKTMYYTDTIRKIIWRYDYDIETGTPSNREIFLEFAGPGRPDGLCIDTSGRILTALWPGWGVEIYTSDGKLDERIELPVPQVSSCAFGGPDFKTLFITTAQEGMDERALSEAPLSGQVFKVEMDIPGLAVAAFNGY